MWISNIDFYTRDAFLMALERLQERHVLRNVLDNSIQVGFSRRNHIQIKAVMTLQLWAPEKSLYPQLGACQQGKRTFKLHTILSQLYPSRSSWAPTDSRAICCNPYWRLLNDLMALERPGIFSETANLNKRFNFMCGTEATAVTWWMQRRYEPVQNAFQGVLCMFAVWNINLQ